MAADEVLSTGISASEQSFFERGIEDNCRVDGRTNLEYRPHRLSCGIVPTEFGSARVSNGEADVIAGVRAEVVCPYLEEPNKGEVFLNVSFANQNDVDRRLESVGEDHQSYSCRLGTEMMALMFNECLYPREALCIKKGVLVWNIYIDVLVLGLGGSLLDTCALAVVAAIRQARLPKVAVVLRTASGFEADSTDAMISELSKAPPAEQAAQTNHEDGQPNADTGPFADRCLDVKTLALGDLMRFRIEGRERVEVPNAQKVPIVVSLGIMRNNAVADLSQNEFYAVPYRVVGAVMEDGSLVSITKQGGGVISMAILNTVSLRITSLAKELFRSLLSPSALHKTCDSSLDILDSLL